MTPRLAMFLVLIFAALSAFDDVVATAPPASSAGPYALPSLPPHGALLPLILRHEGGGGGGAGEATPTLTPVLWWSPTPTKTPRPTITSTSPPTDYFWRRYDIGIDEPPPDYTYTHSGSINTTAGFNHGVLIVAHGATKVITVTIVGNVSWTLRYDAYGGGQALFTGSPCSGLAEDMAHTFALAETSATIQISPAYCEDETPSVQVPYDVSVSWQP